MSAAGTFVSSIRSNRSRRWLGRAAGLFCCEAGWPCMRSRPQVTLPHALPACDAQCQHFLCLCVSASSCVVVCLSLCSLHASLPLAYFCLSASMFLCLDRPVSLSLSVSVSLCREPCLSVSRRIYVSVSLPTFVSLSPCFVVSIDRSLCPSLSLCREPSAVPVAAQRPCSTGNCSCSCTPGDGNCS